MTPGPFTILIDGKCHLCSREARLLARLDGGRGGLIIQDITAPDFDPVRFGYTEDRLMGQIHGVLPDGKVITGVEVFRRAYAAVGKGWLLAWTGWPVFRWAVDRMYVWFARHRLALSAATAWIPGSRPLQACEGDRCRIG